MLDLTKTQIEILAKWASAQLQQMFDDGTYDGDVWMVYDGDTPELTGKIDVNIYDWEDDSDLPIIKACAYEIVDGSTNCENWVVLF
jgi:hypothetical protein